MTSSFRPSPWSYQEFVTDFTVFGNYLLAMAAIAEKYCTLDGDCTDPEAAKQATIAVLDRLSTADLLTLLSFTQSFVERAAPSLVHNVQCALTARGVAILT